jgi:hypothetical protein
MDYTTVIHSIEIRKIIKKKLSVPSFVEYMNETAVKALFAQPDKKRPKVCATNFL